MTLALTSLPLTSLLCAALLAAPLSLCAQQTVILVPAQTGPGQGAYEIGQSMSAKLAAGGMPNQLTTYDRRNPGDIASLSMRALNEGAELVIIPEFAPAPLFEAMKANMGEQVFTGLPDEGGDGLVLGFEWSPIRAPDGPSQTIIPAGTDLILDPARVTFVDVTQDAGSDLQQQARALLARSAMEPGGYTLFPPDITDALPVLALPRLSAENGCGCEERPGMKNTCDPDNLMISPEQFAPLPGGKMRLQAGNGAKDGCGCDGFVLSADQFPNTDWGRMLALENPGAFDQSMALIADAKAQVPDLRMFTCDPD